MEIFIGLDVSLASTSVCAIDPNGETVNEAKVPSDPGSLAGHLRELPGKIAAVGLEAGAVLQRAGHVVGEPPPGPGPAVGAFLDLGVHAALDDLEHDVVQDTALASDGADAGQVGAAGVAGLDGDRLLDDGLRRLSPVCRFEFAPLPLSLPPRRAVSSLSVCDGGRPEFRLVLRVALSSRTVIMTLGLRHRGVTSAPGLGLALDHLAMGEVPAGEPGPVQPVGLEVEPDCLGDHRRLVVDLQRHRAPACKVRLVEPGRVSGDHDLAVQRLQKRQQRHMRRVVEILR